MTLIGDGGEAHLDIRNKKVDCNQKLFCPKCGDVATRDSPKHYKRDTDWAECCGVPMETTPPRLSPERCVPHPSVTKRLAEESTFSGGEIKDAFVWLGRFLDGQSKLYYPMHDRVTLVKAAIMVAQVVNTELVFELRNLVKSLDAWAWHRDLLKNNEGKRG